MPIQNIGANGYKKALKYMSKNVVIVFIRNPELGKVKTRLASTIGNEAALEVYKRLLDYTQHVLSTLNCDVAVYYSNIIKVNDIWDKSNYFKFIQEGEDLGERMRQAFQEQFHLKYQNVVIVGSDLFDLKAEHINQTFKKLEQNDVVIGPAIDGGYYLLGMKTFLPSVFLNKEWSSPNVFSNTIKDLRSYNFEILETLNDIDTFEDLELYPEILKQIAHLK